MFGYRVGDKGVDVSQLVLGVRPSEFIFTETLTYLIILVCKKLIDDIPNWIPGTSVFCIGVGPRVYIIPFCLYISVLILGYPIHPCSVYTPLTLLTFLLENRT